MRQRLRSFIQFEVLALAAVLAAAGVAQSESEFWSEAKSKNEYEGLLDKSALLLKHHRFEKLVLEKFEPLTQLLRLPPAPNQTEPVNWDHEKWKQVPEDFPKEFEQLLKPDQATYEWAVARLDAMLEWHNGTEEREWKDRKRYPEVSKYYPKFHYYWNGVLILAHTKRLEEERERNRESRKAELQAAASAASKTPSLMERLKSFASYFGGGESSPSSSNDPAWIPQAKARVAEMKEENLDILRKAWALHQDPGNIRFFATRLSMDLNELMPLIQRADQGTSDRRFRDSIKANIRARMLREFRERMGSFENSSRMMKKGQSPHDESDPADYHYLEGLASFIHEKSGVRVRSPEEFSRLIEAEPDVLLEFEKSQLRGDDFRSMSKMAKFSKSSRRMSKSMMMLDHIDREEELEPDASYGPEQVISRIQIRELLRDAMGALDASIERKKSSFTLISDQNDGVPPPPPNPDTDPELALREVLDRLRQFHDRLYEDYRKLQNRGFENYFTRRDRPSDVKVYDYLNPSSSWFAHRKFLHELGVKSWSEGSQSQDLSYLFHRPILQGKVPACVQFAILGDMESTHRLQTGSSIPQLSPWYAHAIVTGVIHQNWGTDWMKKTVDDLLPLRVNAYLPDNLSTAWKVSVKKDNDKKEEFEFGEVGIGDEDGEESEDEGQAPRDRNFKFKDSTGVPYREAFQILSTLGITTLESYSTPEYPKSIRTVPNRHYRVADWAGLELNGLPVDYDFFRILIDHKMAPVIAIRSDVRKVNEGWIKLEPKQSTSPGGHALEVVGYGEGEDPFDLQPGPHRRKRYFIVRDSFVQDAIHHKVAADALLDFLQGIYKVKSVSTSSEVR